MKKGKLIVLEGTDGAGKTTQTEILIQNLKARGLKVDTMSFPGYARTEGGKLIEKYLKGELGALEDTNPYLVAPLYALDRFESNPDLLKKLAENDVVILTRYVISNIAYMSAKLPVDERDKFKSWLDNLEYVVYGNAKEDAVVFLSLPPTLSDSLIKKRSAGKEAEKNIHEENLKYMRDVWREYIAYCDNNPHCFKIDCFEGNKILPIDVIATQVQKVVLEILK